MKPQTPPPAQPRDLSALTGHIRKAESADPAAPAPTSTTGNTSNTSTASSAGNASKRSVQTKLTIYVPTDLAGRARSAWRVEAAQPGQPFTSFSAWVSQAIEAAVQDSEDHHNGGKPYVPTQAGEIPTGRPA
ncbi:hypothetical protein [Actinomyces urogenitalis]|uniref:hypothetical protein n=1 Tax=Actinomyces urogenitalis TaxID=103621 RepID=UPI002430A0AE|nr:hypothetical protein [Actinomyces urogenitalis]MCI7456323.1 hypothetical protein [Actinomyces urogenitalis]